MSNPRAFAPKPKTNWFLDVANFDIFSANTPSFTTLAYILSLVYFPAIFGSYSPQSRKVSCVTFSEIF